MRFKTAAVDATHTLYRIHLKGRENVPSKGGALLVPNHVSMVDAVLLIASIDRPIRFLMFKGSYDHWLVKPFAKIMRVIPISSQLRPREMITSLRTATQALKDGEVVCIFPEGQMTRIGQMLPFRRGMERIVKGVDAPIIPVNLGGVWGSIFSFERGKFLWKLPRKIPYPVTVTFGKPVPSTTSAQGVRQEVQELGAGASNSANATCVRCIARSCKPRGGIHFALQWRMAGHPSSVSAERSRAQYSSHAGCAQFGLTRRWLASCFRHPFPVRWSTLPRC